MGDDDLDACGMARPARGREDLSGEAHFALQRWEFARSQKGLFIDGRSTFFGDAPEPVPVALDAATEAFGREYRQDVIRQWSPPLSSDQCETLPSLGGGARRPARVDLRGSMIHSA